jgi:hypothetical protein
MGVILGSGRPAPAGEIDPRTRAMLETLFAGYRSNRAKITDFTMAGSYHEIHKQDGQERERTIGYKYYESEEKKRLDEFFPEDSPIPGLPGRTRFLVDTGEGTLTHVTPIHEEETVAAGIHWPLKFHQQSKITRLDCSIISAHYKSHVGQIRRMLEREWDPQTQNLTVNTITRNGESLLEVRHEYHSNKDKKTVQQNWIFAPERGYEVLEVDCDLSFANGDPMLKVQASYEVREVSPGIWRSAGAELVSDEWEEDGTHAHVERQFKSENVSVNDGSVNSGFFTFEGIGLPSGAYVTDFTVNPPITYQYNGVPFTDYKYLLDKASLLAETGPSDLAETGPSDLTETVPSNTAHEPEEEQTAEEATSEEAAEEMMPEQDANSGGPPVISTPAQINRGWKGTVFWLVLVLVLSIVLGYVSRGSKLFSFLKKGGPKVVLFLLLVLIVAGPAGAIETKEHDDPMLVNKELKLYRTEENTCGVTSLYHALKEIGYDASFSDVLAHVPLRFKGSSIADMSRYLERVGVDHQVVKSDSIVPILTAVRPKAVGGILHTEGESHFVVVKRTADGRFIVLNGTNVIKEDVINYLKQRYSGMAIMVGMGSWEYMTHFANWRRFIAVMAVIPFGFGIGALVRTVFEGVRRRSLVPEKHLVKQ